MEAEDRDDDVEERDDKALTGVALEDLQWLHSRATCVKRKLEDLDISAAAADFRPRREPRDDLLEACKEVVLTASSECTLLAQQGGVMIGSKVEDHDICSLHALPKPTSTRSICMDTIDDGVPVAAADNSSNVKRPHFALHSHEMLTTCHASNRWIGYLENTSNPIIQFFVRTFNNARTIVLQAHVEDNIELVHRFIYEKTGIPISEQRLIYSGRQLQRHQTLAECGISNDATLQLVGRMLSTQLHRSWQVAYDIVATINSVLSLTGGGTCPRMHLTKLHAMIRTNVRHFLRLAADSLPISDHMQVFQHAGATSALVVLLLSPIDTNQECAERSITFFASAFEDWPSADIHHYCAPVLLDFCKLLRKAAPRHYLYFICRSALASILDTVSIAHGTVYFNDAKSESIVHELAPFVTELAVKISLSLCFPGRFYGVYAASGLPFVQHPDAKEGHDFTAFIGPLCKAMTETFANAHPSTLLDHHKHSAFDILQYKDEDSLENVSKAYNSLDEMIVIHDEVEKGGEESGSCAWLFAVFHRLLYDIDSCLKRVEEASTVRPYNWSSVLIVLKGLNFIAKMCGECMQTLCTSLSSRSNALNMIIQQSECLSDHVWLLEHKSLLDFESKKRLILGLLPEPQEDFEERFNLFVHRDSLFMDSFHAFEHEKAEDLQGGLSVEFVSEEATGPGVLREWFYLVCKEIFNPENGLFLSCPNDPRRVFPNPASGTNPEHLHLFRFSGQVLALALMHKVQVDVVFSLQFFKQLAQISTIWEDVKDADPVLYQSCKKILELDAELVDMDILGLAFINEFEELGRIKTVELCEGGKNMVVNSSNRLLYVELLVNHRFSTCVEKQLECFSQGFSDLLVHGSLNEMLQALEPSDLDLLLFGKDATICIEDWKLHTEYHGYESSDCHILWFWEAVSSMNDEQRRRLLFFSSSIAHLPVEGFVRLASKFHIHRAHTDITWLPTAHTCFYQLVLPPYSTYEIMREKLYAVVEGHIYEGFGFA